MLGAKHVSETPAQSQEDACTQSPGEDWTSQGYCPDKILSYFRAKCYLGRLTANIAAKREHYCTGWSELRFTKEGSL